MKYRLLFYFLFLVFPIFAQHDLFVGGSLLAGVTSNKYGAGGNQLHSGRLLSNLGGSLFVQYRFLNRLGFETGLMQQVQYHRLHDRSFEKRNPDFEVRLLTNNQFWSYYGALSYAQPLDDDSKIYTAVGYAFNKSGDKTSTQTKTFVINNEVATFTSNFKNNTSVYLEAGYETYLSDMVVFFAGIRYNKGLSNFTEGSFKMELNGDALTSETYTNSGNYVMLNAGFKFTVLHRDRRVKSPKPIPIHTTTPTTPKPVTEPKKLEGRPLVVGQKIWVKNPTIKVSVWDDQKIDGDRVSLNLNGEWIVRDYTLAKEKKTFVVNIHQGENTLILHALNLGTIKPNTAALLIDDGITQQKILLESDLESSGTLLIEYIR